jgi:hypothetical protein
MGVRSAYIHPAHPRVKGEVQYARAGVSVHDDLVVAACGPVAEVIICGTDRNLAWGISQATGRFCPDGDWGVFTATLARVAVNDRTEARAAAIAEAERLVDAYAHGITSVATGLSKSSYLDGAEAERLLGYVRRFLSGPAPGRAAASVSTSADADQPPSPHYVRRAGQWVHARSGFPWIDLDAPAPVKTPQQQRAFNDDMARIRL